MKRTIVAVAMAFCCIPVFATASTCPTLSFGATGPAVTTLQKFLNYEYTNFPAPTGYFGTLTQEAVQEWQYNNGIVTSGTPATTGYGVVGPKTAAAMGLSCSAASSTPVLGGASAPVTSVPTATGRTLARGMSGSDVTALQAFLVSQGLLTADSATGYFGALTEAAVQQFQTTLGIVSNGTPSTTGYGAVGPRTHAAIVGSAPTSGGGGSSGSTPQSSPSGYLLGGQGSLQTTPPQTISSSSGGAGSGGSGGSGGGSGGGGGTIVIPTIQNPPAPAATPTCSIAYATTSIANNSTATLGVSWDSQNAVSRSYKITGSSGTLLFTSGTIAVSGSLQDISYRSLGTGTYTRIDTVTGPTGLTNTCSTQLSISSPISTPTPPVPTPTPTPTPTPSSCLLKDGSTATQLAAMISSGCTTITTDTNAHVTLATSGTTTIPANVQLVFDQGSRWTISTGSTVVIQGTYQIPLQRAQFFDGGGQIESVDTYDTLGCPAVQRVAYPEWFGAKVNDGTDDSNAILQALALGNTVNLAAGTYDIQNRLPLLGHQSIVGAGKGLTTLSQMANFNLVRYTPNVPPYSDIFVQDFIVSPTSDCSSISNLTIDGSRIPNGTITPGATWGALMDAIQISSSYGWRLGQPPVKNTSVKNVAIVSPLSACINIQSNRGVDGVLIDGVSCTARTGGNTSAVTIEGYDPTYANQYKNVTIQNSTFTGGTTVFYIAGVTNLVMNNDTLTAQTGSNMAMLWYTGDVGFKSTGTITNSRFTFDAPDGNGDSVIRIDARGYVKDYEQPAGNSVFPYLQDVGSTLSMDSDTISSAATTIPLIRDEIGLSQPLKITNSTLTGGSYGILAGDPSNPTVFGATLYVMQPDGSYSPQALTPNEIAAFHVQHSDLDIENSTFAGQTLSSVNVIDDAVKIIGNTFNDIGTSPTALDYPIIKLGDLSPFDTGSAPQNTISNNRFSGVYDSALALVPNISGRLSFNGNTPFVFDAQSKSAATMDTLRAYDCSSCITGPQSPPAPVPTPVPFNAINYACPSNDLTNGTCTLTHVIGVHATSGLSATFFSFVHPSLVYVVNFGDGTEIQVPTCVLPTAGQPNSCGDAGYFTHTYAAAGTYRVSVIDYSCQAGSTSCNQNMDSTSVTVP